LRQLAEVEFERVSHVHLDALGGERGGEVTP
jgi:hypothetical protein